MKCRCRMGAAISWCIPLAGKKLTIRQITLFGMLGAITFAAKVAMSALPNIEPVSLFFLIYGAVFGRKALYPLFLYVVLEILCYGIQLWNINYLYIWLVPVLIGWLCRREENALFWAVVSGGFGLFFGLLCAPVYLFIGGPGYALSWWVTGFPFDLLHCAGNFAMALVLFRPLRKLLDRLYHKL